MACQGAAKLLLNLYRSWVAEHSVRSPGSFINGVDLQEGTARDEAEVRGVEIPTIIAESDPVGSFLGISISEPLLQIGILVSVSGYLTYLKPFLALVAFVVLSPQLVFVPWIQRLINRQVEVGTIVAFISGLSTIRVPWGDLVLWFQNLMMTHTKYQLIADAVSEA